jgi:prevent-host-death family protein
MKTVNMLQAKTNLSRLVDAVEKGEEHEIVIARNGRPAARLVPVEAKKRGVRLGVAEGKFTVPDDIDRDNDLIAKLFYGEDFDEEAFIRGSREKR